MATLEELIAEKQVEIDAIKTANGGEGMHVISSSGRREYTDAEYTDAVNSLANHEYRQQQYGYIEARQEAYGSVQDQLDMQYWDAVNDTTTWKDHIATVKSDNPKP